MTDPTTTPAEGDLKFWWIPQVPMKAFEVPIKTLEQGALLVNVLADYDLFQWNNRIKPDYSNAGGIVRWEDDEWCEVNEDEYEDLA